MMGLEKKHACRKNEFSPRGKWGEKFLSDVSGVYFRFEVFESESAKG